MFIGWVYELQYVMYMQLDISEIGRDKVSGQASAVIPALRRYNPNPG
jgi:hypothetical protein